MRDDDLLEEVVAPAEISTLEMDWLLEDDSLTRASRAVLVLHFKEGMTLAEVGAALDVPIGTAKSRLHYGLAALNDIDGYRYRWAWSRIVDHRSCDPPGERSP